MGNHNNPAKNSDKDKKPHQINAVPKPESEINIKKFNKINVVGKGGFGKVLLISFRLGLGHRI